MTHHYDVAVWGESVGDRRCGLPSLIDTSKLFTDYQIKDRQTVDRKRRVIRTRRSPVAVRACSDDTEIGKRREYLPQDISRFERTKDSHSANSPRTSVEVEVPVKFIEIWFGVLGRAEMLGNIGLRTQDVLLLAGP